ncbi:MAG: RNA polymerase sigma factor [Cyclobacteriaceae bacterium]|nr:MAG: RNA polymerase sigma factor [Cyclobacteriaceae bacterium]
MSDNQHVCDEPVFRSIFERYSRDLYNFLYYKYGAENNPEDLMQEAFARLWDNCKKVSPEKAKSFLFTVANNQMLNDLARKKTVLNYQKDYTEAPPSVSPQYILEETEYLERLKGALEDLTEEQRVAFMMNRVEGLKHREIAERLGISQKAVEKRIYKAVESLQKKLGKF